MLFVITANNKIGGLCHVQVTIKPCLQLCLLWSQPDREQGTQFLKQWRFDELAAGPKPLIKVGLTLLKHMNGILNYFPHQITSGAVEGTVNKIKTLKRQAYGFKDMDYFKLRLYHLHRQAYSLTG